MIESYFRNPKKSPGTAGAERRVTRTSWIRNKEGRDVFKMTGVRVPESWSQLATDVLASKYFRGKERSIDEVSRRIASAIANAGVRQRVLGRSQAQILRKELCTMIDHQIAAFNSPVWFNLGVNVGSNAPKPQCSACFIQSLEDSMTSIFDLLRSEALLFKQGSGSGTNFSALRGRDEKLSSGGTSSGLLSFLEVFDKAAGATKSGGIARRAAKMVCLDVDHPEIETFVEWKVQEERKAQVLMHAGFGDTMDSESYRTVSGQNSNNSVRVSSAFLAAVRGDRPWSLKARTTGKVVRTVKARELFEKLAAAAWECADPGMQYETTIDQWHTCKATGPIRASNPCSEFMFLDDTACNLASINLLKMLDENGELVVERFRHAVRTLILSQEILVDASGYPTGKITTRSHEFRPLGLGYANLGACLMKRGVPYDSDKARAWAGGVTALMTAWAYEMSAELARKRGPFIGYGKNKKSMLAVIKMHVKSVSAATCGALASEAQAAWKHTEILGRRYGFRNAQVTVLAPTGTIGLVMDCDTTGIEPEFSLVKLKKLAGGGVVKRVSQIVPEALRRLGYAESDVKALMETALGRKSFEFAPVMGRAELLARGVPKELMTRIETDLKERDDVLSLRDLFSEERIGKAAVDRIGVGQDVLKGLGFTEAQIEDATDWVLGTGTFENTSRIKTADLAVFDCAQPAGRNGRRYISAMGHLKMMAAVQPFLSGAISKTINLPHHATVGDVMEIFLNAERMGLKSVALYRDGSKGVQPLEARVFARETRIAPEAKHSDRFQDILTCLECGFDTVDNGSCKRCLNCGSTTGCG